MATKKARAKGAAQKQRTRKDAYPAKLDPILMLGAEHADKEKIRPTVQAASLVGKGKAFTAAIEKIGVGIHSLTCQMSEKSVADFLAEDLVPVLISGNA